MNKSWCGGQDSNLRTDKEWDLNPPPLTKLGDPRAKLTAQSLSFQINAYDMAVNPAALINWIISPIDIFSEAVIIPESDSWEISALVMCSFAIKTLVNLDEHPPHVIPFIDRRWVFSPISSGHQSGFNEFVRCRD